MNFDKKKASIDPETAAILENGIGLGKYLLVLKEALVIHLSLIVYRKETIKT